MNGNCSQRRTTKWKVLRQVDDLGSVHIDANMRAVVALSLRCGQTLFKLISC